MAIDGILNVDKPRGKTSFQVVAVVRRLSGERRVGHGGTLDPQATGVLPVCLGQATRVVEFLAESGKTYRAEIELGVSTDTYDAAGKVTARGDASRVTEAEVEAGVARFTGLVDQIPPMYSAVKHQGVPLYRWARAGVELPREARKVEFSRIDILEWCPPLLTLELECGKGAYVRALAHDLGVELRCGGHLRNLARLSCGPFHISEGVSLGQLEDACRKGSFSELVYPMDVAVRHLPAVTVSADDERALANGRALVLGSGDGPREGQCKACSPDGRLIAILRRDEEQGCWRPRKVFVKVAGKA